MIKLKAVKEGLKSLTIDNKEYKVDKKGCIEIESNLVEIALSHGFELFIEETK